MKTNRRINTVRLTECSVMLALSVVLTFVKVWEMPMGGSVTLLSMLPVMLISVKYPKWGFVCSSLFALTQLFAGIASGNVFVWCTSLFSVAVCALFDYLLPFTVLGAAGLPGNLYRGDSEKKRYVLMLAGFAAVMLLRFVCHFVTGVVIWGQWAPEGQSKYLYSLLYNGQYMLPEGILTFAAAAVLLKIPAVKKLLKRI